MRLVSKRGDEIRTFEDWREFAPPKQPHIQWQPGRSAASLAAAWCSTGSPVVPVPLRELLTSHPDTAGCTIIEATPEQPIEFDNNGGEPRNADLALAADVAGVPIAITVEAKADESFGEYTGTVLADAIDRELTARSRGVERVRALAAALLPPRGTKGSRLPALAKVRYQLLTAAAGSLAWARSLGSDRAVLIIDEYVTDKTEDELHEANARDLDVFVRRLSAGGAGSSAAGRVLGPFKVPGRPLFDAPANLYIGKVTTNLRTRERR